MSEKNPERIRHEHDYILNEIKLIDWKKREWPFEMHMAEISYEENIFQGIHLSMFVVDAVDYPTLLPIIGEERIKVSFTRQIEKVKENSIEGGLYPPIEVELAMYAMDGKQQDQGSRKRQTYTMYFTSDGTFKNAHSKVFRAYKGVLYSDMVKNIFDEYIGIKSIEIEPTQFLQDYLVQNERPYAAIKKICKRAISANPVKDPVGNVYTFFEDREKFYFCTLNYLLKREPKIKLRYEVRQVTELDGDALEHKPRTTERDVYNVNYYRPQGGIDVLQSTISGEGAGRVLTVDPIRRKFEERDYNLQDQYANFAHVDKKENFSKENPMLKSPLASFQMVPTNKDHDTAPYISTHEPGISPTRIEDWKWHKKSHMAQMFKNTITTTVSGDPRIRAGDVVEFFVPELLGKTSKRYPEELDKYIQGKYLVVSVAHVLKHGKYSMNLELLKDNFYTAPEARDPIEEYKDIQ